MARPAAADPVVPVVPAPRPSTFKRIIQKIWWLHSGFALTFGVGVMLFARAGLKYADKVIIALCVSWLLMFVALRFIVGPANRREHENLARRGVRFATNYIIKQFYQQMFFFLVPLYASSATWSLTSFNWWLAPLLLACAVLSTMDLVFDSVVMERRWLAASMYGLAMFGVLNVLMPLVFGVTHLTGLYVAAGAAPIAVALLTFSVRQVCSARGLALTIAATGATLGGAHVGRRAIPPAPMAMAESSVGHGTRSSYECLPPSKHVMKATELDGLRCGSLIREPGGIKEDVVHVWARDHEVLVTLVPDRRTCDGHDAVYLTTFPHDRLPAKPAGEWSCTTMTVGGQLVGVRRFTVVASSTPHAPPVVVTPGPTSGSGSAVR